jgi:hypothetical protein
MPIKKKTLGNNPLDAYFAATPKQQAVDSSEIKIESRSTGKKQRITIHLPIDLIERIKNVVYWEPGLTLTALAQEAFEKVVDNLEKQRGESYPTRKERSLKGGRPLS